MKLKRAESIMIPEMIEDLEGTKLLSIIMKKGNKFYYILMNQESAQLLINTIIDSGIL